MTTTKINISVSGNIGVGKSSFCSKTKNIAHVKDEPVCDIPFLDKFYDEDSAKDYAMSVQVLFLTLRFIAQQPSRQAQQEKDSEIVIHDRSMKEDSVFVLSQKERGLFTEQQISVYEDLSKKFCDHSQKIDAYVYLRATPETCKSRISLRGNAYEKEIEESYLISLHNHYETLMENESKNTLVFEVDWENFDTYNPESIIKAVKDYKETRKVDRGYFKLTSVGENIVFIDKV